MTTRRDRTSSTRSGSGPTGGWPRPSPQSPLTATAETCRQSRKGRSGGSPPATVGSATGSRDRERRSGAAPRPPEPRGSTRPLHPPDQRRAQAETPGYQPRLLVVEDDPNIGDGLRRALEGEGYQVEWVQDGASALRSASSAKADLVVLDLYLPDIDGVDVCQKLREAFPELPIVIVSARTEEIDIVVGLDAGADDYLVKPFRLAELLARLRAHLRRPRADAVHQNLAAGDLEVDVGARRVFVGATEVALRPKEIDLLALLVSEAGRAVTRERIMREVWNIEPPGSSKTLDMHVSSLRRKLAEGKSGTQITTVRGSGYRLDP